MAHKHKKVSFGKIVNGIGKVTKPVFHQVVKTMNAPTQLAGDLIHSAGSFSLPLLIIGGIGLVVS